MPVKYKYYVNTTQVYPTNDKGLKVVYAKSIPSAVFLEKTLNGVLTFKSKGEFNFKTQQEEDPTTELDFIIKRFCDGEYEDYLKLVFTVGEGDFDDDLCLFTVKPKNKNEFRKDIKVNIVIKQNLINPGTLTPGVSFRNNASIPTDDRNYPQAFYFDQTILSIAKESNPKITGLISNFFQINPTIVSSDALPGVPNKWTNMAFAALSDIQEPVPSDLARIEFLTFQELLDDLNALFDVYWYIDDNNNLRIEHRVFFDGTTGLNLTDDKYKDHILGTNKYNYDLDDYPRTESLKIVSSRQYATFTNGYFATINKNNNEIIKESKKINTDLTNIMYFGGSSTADGVFLFSCAGTKASTTFNINANLNIGEGYTNEDQVFGQNVFLTPHYLYRYLHTYGRFDSGSFFESSTIHSPGNDSSDPQYWGAGQVRAGGIKHITVRPIILQNKISIPLCCDDVFNPQDNITTSMGIGIPETASLDLNSEMLELEIKYPAPEYKFTPLSLTGLQLWLSGDKGVHLNASGPVPGFFYVDQWDDSSGNGRHAVGTGSTKPISDGSPGILFGPNVANPFLTVPAFQLFPGKRGTIFLMYENFFNAIGGQQSAILSTNDGAAGPDFDISIDDSTLISFNEAANPVYPQNFYTAKRLFQMKRFADDKIICRDNSRDIPNYQEPIGLGYGIINPGEVDNVLHAIKDLIVGHNTNLPNQDNNYIIYEVIIYDHVLSDVDAERVEIYLTKRGYYKTGTYLREDY